MNLIWSVCVSVLTRLCYTCINNECSVSVCTGTKAFNYMSTSCFFHKGFALFGEQDKPAFNVGHFAVRKAVPHTTLPLLS